jgi:hypothetical protein
MYNGVSIKFIYTKDCEGLSLINDIYKHNYCVCVPHIAYCYGINYVYFMYI